MGCVSAVRLAICQTSTESRLHDFGRRVQICSSEEAGRRSRRLRIGPKELGQPALLVEALVEGQGPDHWPRDVPPPHWIDVGMGVGTPGVWATSSGSLRLAMLVLMVAGRGVTAVVGLLTRNFIKVLVLGP